MLTPGRYVVKALLGYGAAGTHVFQPDDFATALRGTAPAQLRGNALLTAGLPFNPFVQTYKRSRTDYYALVTLFLTARRYTEEADVEQALAVAFSMALGMRGARASAEQIRRILAPCPGNSASGAVAHWTPSGEFGGCTIIERDPGVTADNWQTQIWQQAFSGYEAWEHTQHTVPDFAYPESEASGGPTPGGQQPVGQRAGQRQVSLFTPPREVAGQTLGEGNIQPVPQQVSLWNEPGVQIAVVAVGIAAAVAIMLALSRTEPRKRQLHEERTPA